MALLSMERTGRITGSRIAAVLGLSPYLTREDVMREMVREYHWDEPEFAGNFVTDWGVEHEAQAVAEYEMTRGVQVRRSGAEQELILHPTLPLMAGTPDGLVGDDGLVEVKCPWRAAYTDVAERPDYEVQIRLLLECSGRAWGELAVWRPSGLNISRVTHDPGWVDWLNKPTGMTIRATLFEFVEEFTRTIADEELSRPHREPLVDVRVDDEWRVASLEYLDALAATAAATEAQEAAKARLIELSAGKTTKGCGVHLIRTGGGAGAVSYAKALAAYAPDADLERYRGKPKPPGWTLRRATTTEKGT